MTKDSEKQSLLATTSTSLPGKKPKQWHSYTHPEIKHELILYAELAAAAAFIVGLYVLCLLPWEYIHRAQMLTSRLQPSTADNQLSIEYAKKLRDICDINDEIDFTIAYKLTRRPCKTEAMPARDVPMGGKNSGRCNPNILKDDETRFKLGKAGMKHALDSSRYSYHDLYNFFHIECCGKTAKNCPCGYDQIFQNKCYAFTSSTCSTESYFNQTQISQLIPLLKSQNLEYYCNDEEKYDLNGIKVSSCYSNANNTIFSGGNNETEYYLCESNFIDKNIEWWRRD